MKAIICDLDGTLCDVSHRRHFVSDGRKDYDKFNAACVDDPLVIDICDLLILLDRNYYDIILCSGRDSKYRKETIEWLAFFGVPYNILLMREEGDYRSDVVVKREMLSAIRNKGYEVKWVIDDRQSVVDMWREEGLTCLQCAPGDFDVKKPAYKGGILHLLVGPSGAGKSTYIDNECWSSDFNGDMIVSSDNIRAQLCSDFRDQSKNKQVFSALHAIVKARIQNGLDVVVDATNIKNADRRALRDLCNADTKIVYHVLNRNMNDKKRDGGWRNEIMIGNQTLIERHEEIFNANLKDILAGDNDKRVEVRDCRH